MTAMTPRKQTRDAGQRSQAASLYDRATAVAPSSRLQSARTGRVEHSRGSGPAPLVVAVFALVTGVALLLAGAMLPDLRPLSPGDSALAANETAAGEFYAAQDAALATGDTDRLVASVGPSFVDHRPGAATAEQDRAGLVRDVAALRAARPGVRLTAEGLWADGDRVLAYVSMRPSDAAGGDGAAMPPQPTADTLEMVRIAGGLVVERWSLDDVSGSWPRTIVTPTPAAPWAASRFATATAEGQVCGASHCS